ncbi:ataxin-2-like protein isoform X2 [Phyllobates terribilis]|uniref:ataxin-2-like protein isoform X2 n=1 Tax=Phyllobates terribilis TaxID=111132 RepID=UPI003CCAF52B
MLRHPQAFTARIPVPAPTAASAALLSPLPRPSSGGGCSFSQQGAVTCAGCRCPRPVHPGVSDCSVQGSRVRSARSAADYRGRSIVKGLQPPVFEGIYNNSRMLHFLTAVVGSTCDVKVKNGTTYQGIFKTLSSKFELAIDAVHKKTSDQVLGPKREEIVDTMIFKHSDVMLVHFHNVDFSYATKDKFTDSAIAMNSKVNGEHKDKVLMRWDGGENSDDYDLDSDISNGWDANEMFKINEDIHGVKTTYDSSLSSYTVPLEKDNSEEFRQREARATLLAREIESSPQYRARIAIENDECRTEEEKHSSVQRPSSDRDSPSLGSRDGKYNPLPQRVRDGSRGALRTNSSRGGRSGMGMTSRAPPQHYPDTSSSPVPEQRGINGGPSRMSPKSQRPIRSTKPMSSPSSRPIEVSTSPSGSSRIYTPLSPKSASSASSMDSSSQSSTPDPRPAAETSISIKPASPKNVAPSLEGKDAQAPVKEPSRTMELSSPCEIAKPPCKVLQTEQKRNQLDELRKFGAEFRLQATPCPDTSIDSFSRPREQLESKMAPLDPGHSEIPESRDLGQKIPESVEETKEEQRMCESNEHQEEAASSAGKAEAEEKEEQVVCDQVKKSTLNPNAKEFNPTKSLLAVNKATSTPTSPSPRSHSSTTTIPMLTAGQSSVYSPYISYIPPLHMSPAVQAPQMYPYPVSNSVPGQQGKFRAKGPPQRSDQQNSANSIMQAAAAAGPPLMAATPYPSYISYSPQQFPGQPTMMQPMAHYPSQPVFAQMLQGNPRMIASGNHPQALVSSSNPQYQPTEQPTPQTLYATVHQSYSHHAAQLHPQPASTPTQSSQQSQHANPSPVQHQAGQPPHLGSAQPQQNLYHTAALTATPTSLTPGPTAQSPQNSYPQQAVYAIHAHQQLQHGYTNMSHVAQAHLQTGVTGAPPHPGGPHPPHPGAPHPTPVMLLHPSQTHGGPPQAAVSQTGVSTQSPYTYIPHPQVQSHPSQQLPFHPPGN